MSRGIRTITALGVMLGAALFLAACGTAPPAAAPTQPPAPAPTTVQELPPSPTPAVETAPTFTAVPSPTAASVLDGQTLVQERCTRCHSLDRVRQSRKSEADWKATVERMVGKGAALSAQEIEAVVRYLAQTYPK